MAKKRGTGRTSTRISKKNSSVKSVKFGSLGDKTKLVINNLLLFAALSLVAFVLFRFIQNDFLNNLFFVIAVVFGFIGVGFLIVLLILFVLKLISKKGKKKR
jgi:hypothetical protein